MSRLDELRQLRDFIDREIEAELQPSGPTARDLVQRAADLYSVAAVDVLGGSRRVQVAKARQAACWLLRRCDLSYPEIGRIVGVHHTTALYACHKIDGSPSVRGLLVGLEVAS